MYYASSFFCGKLADMNIYQQELMDHYRSPHNYGLLEPADFLSHEHNPSCGDLITVSGKFDEQGRLAAVGFEGTGCVISIATASLLFAWCLGKTGEELNKIDRTTIIGLIGIELGPTRLKCALLPVEALRQGLLSCK